MDSASEKRALLQSLCPGTFCVFINVLRCWIFSVGDSMYEHLIKTWNAPCWTKEISECMKVGNGKTYERVYMKEIWQCQHSFMQEEHRLRGGATWGVRIFIISKRWVGCNIRISHFFVEAYMKTFHSYIKPANILVASHSEITLTQSHIRQWISQDTRNIMFLYQNVQHMLWLSYFPTHYKCVNVSFLQLTCCSLFLSKVKTIPVSMKYVFKKNRNKLYSSFPKNGRKAV